MDGGASFVADPTRTLDPRGDLSRDAAAVYRLLGNEELGALRDALASEAADLPSLYGDESAPVAALLIEPWLRAADHELARRARLFAAGLAVPDPSAARYEAWRAVAGEVRQHADILAVFHEAGHHLRQTGRDEWHAQCFVCGEGHDRLMVRTDPPGRYWCRRCGVTGDAITAYRSFTGAGFFPAVRHLAAVTGIAVPAERSTPLAGRSARRLVELPPRGPRHAR